MGEIFEGIEEETETVPLKELNRASLLLPELEFTALYFWYQMHCFFVRKLRLCVVKQKVKCATNEH